VLGVEGWRLGVRDWGLGVGVWLLSVGGWELAVRDWGLDKELSAKRSSFADLSIPFSLISSAMNSSIS